MSSRDKVFEVHADWIGLKTAAQIDARICYVTKAITPYHPPEHWLVGR